MEQSERDLVHGLVEECRGESLDVRRRTIQRDASGDTVTHGAKTPREATRRSGRIRLEEVMALLDAYPCSPVEKVTNTEVWFSDPRFLLVNPRGWMVKDCMRLYQQQINGMSVLQLMQYQTRSDVTPLYKCGKISSVVDTYYSCEVSTTAILRMLLFHFGGDLVKVKGFLATIHSFLNKDGKCNTILIVGAPNAGKNFFVDCVGGFCLNTGMIANPIRQNAFPWMVAQGRRCNTWNHARFDPDFNDNVLDLMQGTEFSAAVKYEKYKTIEKTPLFVMANNDVFPREHRFDIRHVRYDWRPCPLLIDYRHKKPYPLAIGYLLLWAVNDPHYSYINIEKVVTTLGF